MLHIASRFHLIPIICIGMSHDIRGFLAAYKALNPNATIIALDQEAPCFLGENDLFVRGDLQLLLPEIEKAYWQLASTDTLWTQELWDLLFPPKDETTP